MKIDFFESNFRNLYHDFKVLSIVDIALVKKFAFYDFLLTFAIY